MQRLQRSADGAPWEGLHLCIEPENVSGANGVAHVTGGEYSYRLVWIAVGAAPTAMFLTFTWAYTAP